MEALKYVEEQTAGEIKKQSFKSGDTVTVHYKIKEGNKERIQKFQGIVLQRKGSGATETFTVRKISNGIGVERVFPVASPNIEKIEINKKGQVRRARIFYLRQRTGKAARIKEKRIIQQTKKTEVKTKPKAKAKTEPKTETEAEVKA